jgi:anti-sigma factor RsiW
MNCPKSKLLSEYLDNELGSPDKISFEQHLQSCPVCFEELEDLKKIQVSFATTERYKAPYGFSTRVLARAKAQNEKKTRDYMPLFVRFAQITAMFALITIGVITGTVIQNSSATLRTNKMMSSFSLELFEPAPPGSLGGAYIAFMEGRHDE